jgi:cytochrome c oxidase subunit IV
MKSEWRVFGVLAAFVFVAAAVYAWWTQYDSAQSSGAGRVEWIGTVALILSGLLLAMCGSALWLISRRIEPRPEDRPDAEIAEGAGEMGFFSPGSYYPFGLGLASMTASIGLAFAQWWLVAVGVVAVLVGTAGLLFEYYTGSRRSAEH